jgi:hypothetical protein
MMRALIAAASVAALGLANESSAQQRWSVELRGGPAFATQRLGGAELEAGFGFEGTGAFRFMPHASAYAGWGWQRFPAETPFGGTDTDFEETGYAFGVQFDHPFRGEIDGAGYRLRWEAPTTTSKSRTRRATESPTLVTGSAGRSGRA